MKDTEYAVFYNNFQQHYSYLSMTIQSAAAGGTGGADSEGGIMMDS